MDDQDGMANYCIGYIGYNKDRTFVPYSELPISGFDVYNSTEAEAKARLCMVQKIGRGNFGCTITVDEDGTAAARKLGDITEDMSIFMVHGYLMEDDMPLFDRHINARMPENLREYRPPETFEELITLLMEELDWVGPDDGEPCDLGFCDME